MVIWFRGLAVNGGFGGYAYFAGFYVLLGDLLRFWLALCFIASWWILLSCLFLFDLMI